MKNLITILLLICTLLVIKPVFADVTITVTLSGDVKGTQDILITDDKVAKVTEWYQDKKKYQETPAKFLARVLTGNFINYINAKKRVEAEVKRREDLIELAEQAKLDIENTIIDFNNKVSLP